MSVVIPWVGVGSLRTRRGVLSGAVVAIGRLAPVCGTDRAGQQPLSAPAAVQSGHRPGAAPGGPTGDRGSATDQAMDQPWFSATATVWCDRWATVGRCYSVRGRR